MSLAEIIKEGLIQEALKRDVPLIGSLPEITAIGGQKFSEAIAGARMQVITAALFSDMGASKSSRESGMVFVVSGAKQLSFEHVFVF